MSSRLKGKVALVTGGARGIGRTTALQFAQEAAGVVVADLNATAGEALVSEIMRGGGHALFISVDVCDEASVKSMVNKTVERFGGLDCAFNNAGVPDGASSLLTSTQATGTG